MACATYLSLQQCERERVSTTLPHFLSFSLRHCCCFCCRLFHCILLQRGKTNHACWASSTEWRIIYPQTRPIIYCSLLRTKKKKQKQDFWANPCGLELPPNFLSCKCYGSFSLFTENLRWYRKGGGHQSHSPQLSVCPLDDARASYHSSRKKKGPWDYVWYAAATGERTRP